MGRWAGGIKTLFSDFDLSSQARSIDLTNLIDLIRWILFKQKINKVNKVGDVKGVSTSTKLEAKNKVFSCRVARWGNGNRFRSCTLQTIDH